ncbi:MAG: sugar ABC transporter substrate-binding protein [Eubacteriales bacterium]|nr:sugar ABC transporter substrate-binding protein [Eubacteriales bacterium]
MKKRTVGILMGMTIAAVSVMGCGSNEATEAANESAEIEKEGSGEDAETESSEEETKEERESSDDSSGEADAESEETEEEPALKVGVLLPDESEEIWAFDGQMLKEYLEEDGYEPVLAYARGDSGQQVSQIREMAGEDISAMIIAPVDEYSLTEVLTETKEKDIPVFSYDKLIRDSDGVSYYTTFSGRSSGRMIGEAIVEEQELEKARENQESKTIEFLMGSTDDVQSLFLYNGVMEILQPYLDDGTLVCSSGRTSFEDTGILRWGRERSVTEIEGILDEFYQETGIPDIICTGFDDAACGAVDALTDRGFSPDAENWPMITGTGCVAEAVKYIAEGKISCSVFMDRRDLAEECVKMVDTYLKGEIPEVNDYEEYDNGKKIIGTYICDPQMINEGNYESLIDNGYYEEAEIAPGISVTVTPAPTEEQAEITGTPAPDELSEQSILSVLGGHSKEL